MAIAKQLKAFLERQKTAYDLVSHPRSATASEAAGAAHITGEYVAKAVVVHQDDKYVVAVVPSTHRIDLDALRQQLGARLDLASEEEIAALFDDCDRGAVPPIASAYGLDVIADESLFDLPEIYFEGGDHRNLVHMDGAALSALLKDAKRGHFSHHL